jgi:hypothetical protein
MAPEQISTAKNAVILNRGEAVVRDLTMREQWQCRRANTA